jgi:hypothetical protein
VATRVMIGDRTASQSTNQPNGCKPYRPPILVKGPMLSAVTADTQVSGSQPI